MNRYKLIAIDLDGTLLDSAHEISQENIAAVRECVERGLMVVVATGRLFSSAAVYCGHLGLSGPVITLNGAVIADGATGQMRMGHLLDEERLVLVTDELQRRGIPFAIFTPTGIYALPDTEHIDILRGYGEPPPTIVPRISTAHIDQPAKVLAFLREGRHDGELRELLEGPTGVVRTGPLFLEFLAPHVSKGAALKELMDAYGFAADEVLAIGDSYNDLPMFEVAGMSVAMGGADAAILARAKAVTAGCDESGVAVALRRYVLGGER